MNQVRLPGVDKAGVLAGRDRPTCHPLWCWGGPMRGGIRLDVPRDDRARPWGGCTNGFNVEGAKNGWVYTLTAGHCVLEGQAHAWQDVTYHNGIAVGKENGGTARNQSIADYAIMPYQGNQAQRWVLGTGPDNEVLSSCQAGSCRNGTFGMRGVYRMDQIQTGWVVCETGSGASTGDYPQAIDSLAGNGYLPGTRCGQVTRKPDLIYTDICSRDGDSGGPLFSEVDSMAYGILKGGSDRKGACGSGEVSWYTPLERIFQWSNLDTHDTIGFQLITHP
jgi:streptogrisin C